MTIKALLIGETGSGKTTGALTATSKEGKTLVIDYDNRAEFIEKNFSNVDRVTFEPDSTKDIGSRLYRGGIVSFIDKTNWVLDHLLTLYKEAKEKDPSALFPYETILVDGLTKLSLGAVHYAMDLPHYLDTASELKRLRDKTVYTSSPSKEHYGTAGFELSRIINTFINLPCNVIMTAHPTYEKDEYSGRFYWGAHATGKALRSTISGDFNEVYQCIAPNSTNSLTDYVWVTSSTRKFPFLKSAMNHLGRKWNKDQPIAINWDKPRPRGFEKLKALADK